MSAFRRFKIDWRLKAKAFQVLDRMPMGDHIYCLIQQHVTRTLPRQLSPTFEKASNQLRHIDRLRQCRPRLDDVVLLEFGAGWDLYSNLLYWCLGINTQIVVDIRRWLQPSAVNAVISHLQKDPPPQSVRIPPTLVTSSGLETELKSVYGIDYRAPFDASSMPLEDNSVDIIVTTSVLEHIPLDACRAIFADCRRVLKADGVMSHIIDYSDHYAHSDGGITAYNYLRFDAEEWARYNPAIHYQNRCRTDDYRGVFRAAGFDIISEREWQGDRSDLAMVDVHSTFRSFSSDELLTLGGEFLLRPTDARQICSGGA